MKYIYLILFCFFFGYGYSHQYSYDRKDPSSNPKTILPQPGIYEINIKTLGKHVGSTRTEKVTVTAGETTIKNFKID